MEPRIILNAKVYPQVTGAAGITALAQACQTVAAENNTTIGLAPPMVELAYLARTLELPNVVLYAQHTDAIVPGAGTGHTTAEAVSAAGAAGTLLNHAEHKVGHDVVAATLARAHEVGLKTLVCTDSMAETEALAPLAPTFIAIEPPQLIGGDVSVTNADPAIVREAAAAVATANPATLSLCGAGVKTGADVAAAIELGAYGVLLASGVVKASDPVAALRDLARGLPN